ncbi:putative WRKY transcription factor 25 [Dorcoceras hygrometricum]|uniref:Putative WRKY transcription factor 25 n=1 Tax=Dorcoceras hygrometricum TaxID=472368 RepID=A0A2Z7AZH0_9LAMI|nr:putative WRKY transcription factor 25 [Dorcoceras hygrometricum]
MFKLKAAKGCSIRTSNPQNSTSQSRQSTADLTACEQISPSFKITKPKIPATKLCKALTTRIKLKSTRNAHPKAQGNRRSNLLTAPAIHVRVGSSGSLNSLFLASKLVSMGRESLKESSATKNIKNRGWNRREIKIYEKCSPKSSRKPKIKSAHCTSNSRTRRVFGISQLVVPSFQTSINGKRKSQGVQRHQEHQKQRLESTGNGDRK